MKFLLTFALLLAGTYCFAQKQDVYFLKNSGKYVELRDSADYIRVVSEPDSGSAFYNVHEFYLDNKIKLAGKSSKINPPVFEGQCIRYYKNGKKAGIANYKDGSLTGIEFDFYPNGKVYLEKEYLTNDRYNPTTTNFLIKANYDSLGTALVENGTGHCKLLNNDLDAVTEEGDVKNGLREGQWTGYFKNVNIHFTENYKNGILIDGTANGYNGIKSTYKKTRGTNPEFKGGVEAFGAYLGSNIKYPYAERRNGIQGVVVLSFVVEKDGKITDIKVLRPVSEGIDKEAILILKKSPDWVPGTMFGKPVRVVYSVPINFALK
jgi:TonB family protein